MASKESAFDYEKARVELENIVRQLESGSKGLEESLKLWEKGEELAAACQKWLDKISEQLENTKASMDSSYEDEELSDEEEFDEDDDE